jgi:cysteine desulfurase / selenocysteine lyase
MSAEASQMPVWETYREEFPVTSRLIYLHHAGVAPLCRRAANAMKQLADDALLNGSLHYPDWTETYEGLRRATARLINAEPAEIALVKNTSEGVATVANGFPWKRGDRVVAFREEFPANFFPWKRIEEVHGVQVTWLSINDPIEAVEAAARGARLLAISYVQYLSGFRADLETIGEICHRHGCFFFVDAIQGLGAFPLDVRRARIHALAADGHKWLLGPEGCGVLYIQKDWQDAIFPVEFGWTNVAGYNDYASRDMALRPDAGRYECGTLNTIGCYGLRAAMEFILEVGVERIAAVVQARGDQIAEGVRGKGYELLGTRTAANGAGIVSFRKEGLDYRWIVSRLKEKGIQCGPRQGWVRAAPHFYITPEAIETFLAELP